MKSQAKIISFANHKGGVGKTTTTASVGSALSKKGYKVLMIDLDAQANLTISLLNGEVNESVYHAMAGKCPLKVTSISENLDIIPASLDLAMVDLELSSAMSREYVLINLLKEGDFMMKYDYILLDCPPSLGLITLNAFTASNEIIIPLIAEILPFNGLKMISEFIAKVRKLLNKEAHITGILLTRWENTKLSKQIEEGLRIMPSINVFKTKIRKNVTVAAAPLERKNIMEYDPDCNGAKDYLSFTEELLAYLQRKNIINV